jgi:hypothetical protein
MTSKTSPTDTQAQPPEQERYARLLDWGTRVGLLLLVGSFVAYVSGLLPGVVPVDRLPELWSLPVAQFQARTQMPGGWGWLALLGHGDVLGLLGIALLAGVSIPCLLALVPIYAARGEKAYVAICLLEVAVVALAASGLLSGGH